MVGTSEDFWERCSNAGCVVLPVKTYSDYVDGNINASTYIGIRYAAFPFDNCAVGPDYWFMIDKCSTGSENLFASPVEALTAFENAHPRAE